MTDTTPALQHTAEPKHCVGIFNFNPMETDPKLFDTGMRIYIDPVTSDLEAWGPDDDTLSEAEDILSRIIENNNLHIQTSDQILTWCVNVANEENALGISRLFVKPEFARAHNLIDPSTLDITKTAHSQGL